MKQTFFFIGLILAFSCCNPSKKSAENKNDAPKMNDDSWEMLFDGKTTKGWHKYGGSAVGSAWKVADGVLYLDTAVKKDWQIDNGGDIASDEEFENFDLKLEWKVSKAANSGIMFYVHEESKYKYPWETGPEMQVLDNIDAGDNKKENHLAGTLYDLLGAADKSKPKAVGEWNQVEIKCLNGKLDLYLNGTNVVSTTLWDDNWKKMVAASKFKTMPGFGTYKKGRIALQDHGYMVWYRNIMIRRL
jgi:hypothetical protein